MSYGIYSITNLITGDMYIGQTKVSFETRWQHHIADLKANRHDNDYFQKAWNKYGKEAFKFKAIHICDELDILNDLEAYYIKKYDTFNNGYNLTSGGDGFEGEISEETRLKMIANVKVSARNNSDYTDTQIARVKELLVDRNYIGKLSKISKITGVGENVISSVRALTSWIDIKSELNETIKILNNKQLRNEQIIKNFIDDKMTIDELIEEYNLTQTGIYSILNSNGYKNKISKINKENSDIKLKNKILKAYNKGLNTYRDIENETGISRYNIEKISAKLNINLATNKKTSVKNINWDENSKRYLVRLTKDKKQIVIGGTKDLEEAITIRDKAKVYISSGDDENLSKLIISLIK